MEFDFEKYWNSSGIKTDPAIMGLAFKECAQKAINACISFYRRPPDFRIEVLTLSPKHNDSFIPESIPLRKWGIKGIIIDRHDAHGLCYDVRHEDGSIGTYCPDELRLIE